MRPLVTRVVETLERSGLAAQGDRVLVALSGGPDSVALLWLLRESLPLVGADLAGVAHLNHRLRGVESSGDEAFCRTLAGQLGLRCDIERCDIAALAASRRRSIEAVAHDVRYEFLDRARVRLGATLVATGHTADDQAETMLWHLARGAGVRGLAGIRYRRDRIIRPLLDLSRAELEEWLGERGLAFRLDASNQDRRFTRNRIRHQVLPTLTSAVSPRAVEALARAARLAADEDEFLEQAVTQSAQGVVLTDGRQSRVDLAGLLALPLALRRRLIWRALELAAGGRPVGAVHVDVVLACVTRPEAHAGRLALPGQWVTADAGALTFTPRSGAGGTAEPEEERPGFERRPLPVPGTLEDPGGRWTLSVSATSAETFRDAWPDGPGQAVADAVVGPDLFVRTRRPGDRLEPLGLGGHKKLQDLFVDRKVPRLERDGIPLVVDGQDRIIWVAGHVLSRHARITARTTSVLLFELRRSGGQV
jgi:tRNA(Ile)-lysidine synthase